MTTWLYHVIDGETIRAPIDLDTLSIDWLRVEPWTEPPSKVNDTDCPRYGYTHRVWLMRCDHCDYRHVQKKTGPCHKCGEGMMQAVKRVYGDKP